MAKLTNNDKEVIESLKSSVPQMIRGYGPWRGTARRFVDGETDSVMMDFKELGQRSWMKPSQIASFARRHPSKFLKLMQEVGFPVTHVELHKSDYRPSRGDSAAGGGKPSADQRSRKVPASFTMKNQSKKATDAAKADMKKAADAAKAILAAHAAVKAMPESKERTTALTQLNNATKNVGKALDRLIKEVKGQ